MDNPKLNLCPKCKVELEFVPDCPSGMSGEHLACPVCDGTFNDGDGTYLIVNKFLPMDFKVKGLDGEPFNGEPLGIIFYPDGWFDKIDAAKS